MSDRKFRIVKEGKEFSLIEEGRDGAAPWGPFERALEASRYAFELLGAVAVRHDYDLRQEAVDSQRAMEEL